MKALARTAEWPVEMRERERSRPGPVIACGRRDGLASDPGARIKTALRP